MASNTINIEIKMRKIPLANPESVSTRPYLKIDPSTHLLSIYEINTSTHPYVNRSLGSQVAITDANSPTPIAIQSNAMCIANYPL
jgi:hypothetical protein